MSGEPFDGIRIVAVPYIEEGRAYLVRRDAFCIPRLHIDPPEPKDGEDCFEVRFRYELPQYSARLVLDDAWDYRPRWRRLSRRRKKFAFRIERAKAWRRGQP